MTRETEVRHAGFLAISAVPRALEDFHRCINYRSRCVAHFEAVGSAAVEKRPQAFPGVPCGLMGEVKRFSGFAPLLPRMNSRGEAALRWVKPSKFVQQTKTRNRSHGESLTTSRNSGLSGHSRPWRWRAEKSAHRNPSAGSIESRREVTVLRLDRRFPVDLRGCNSSNFLVPSSERYDDSDNFPPPRAPCRPPRIGRRNSP